MNNVTIKHAVIGALFAMSVTSAQAATTTFNYNFMATNLKGDFATASGGTAISVATLTLTDFAGDGSTQTAQNGSTFINNGGVRATFTVNTGGLNQFNTIAGGSVYITAFELNWASSPTSGYDGTGIGNLWKNVSGLPLGSSGVEWQENGSTDGWGAVTDDPAFGQEINWGNPTTFSAGSNNGMTEGATSTIDFFNAAGRTDISVANLLNNSVVNATSPTQPNAYSWIKLRGSTVAQDATGNGMDASGWWGNSISSGTGTSQRFSLNVLAVQAVPENDTYAMLLAGLGIMGMIARRRSAV